VVALVSMQHVPLCIPQQTSSIDPFSEARRDAVDSIRVHLWYFFTRDEIISRRILC
jgi:hypothetical protein